jgi:hypothetical protein
MVAKVTVPGSIKRALNYNEQKMQKGKAECLYAHNYLKEAKYLNFYEKLERFEKQISLNNILQGFTISQKCTCLKMAIPQYFIIPFGKQR